MRVESKITAYHAWTAYSRLKDEKEFSPYSARMSDPLSIAASVAGLWCIAEKILSMGYQLCSTVKDAPDSIRGVIEEVQQMHCIFGEVERLISGTSTRPAHNRLMMISISNLRQHCAVVSWFAID